MSLSVLGGANDPMLLATDLAEYLVINRTATFREAHHIVGEVVALSEKLGRPIDKLTLAEYQSIHQGFGPEVFYFVFDLELAMAKRGIFGPPCNERVAKKLAGWHRFMRAHGFRGIRDRLRFEYRLFDQLTHRKITSLKDLIRKHTARRKLHGSWRQALA
jgi:hypothetical protein